MAECPKCNRKNAYFVSGKKIVCRSCGYDERTEKKKEEKK